MNQANEAQFSAKVDWVGLQKVSVFSVAGEQQTFKLLKNRGLGAITISLQTALFLSYEPSNFENHIF
jgi:hypothetical protein